MTATSVSIPALTTGAVVVVPTYNEAANIVRLIDRVRRVAGPVEVLVVDDASPDGTADLVRALPGYGADVHLLTRTGERGLGNAYRDGFAWARAHGFGVVVQIDADLSHPPESIPALVAGLDVADVVVGSRYVPGGHSVGWPLSRRVISRCAGLYARTVLRLGPHDPTAGFKGYRIGALDEIDVGSTTTTGYGFQVECLWRAQRRGLRIDEVPIVFTDRVAGSSKMSMGVALEAARRILGWRLGELARCTRLMVALASALTFVLHLLYVGGPLLSDEGGFAMVARWWHLGGPHLYGSQWVDRPPGLISVFWVADHLGPGGVRIMAGLVAAVFVLAAAWAGGAARGRRAALWASWTAFFLVNTPLTETYALNGELVAAMWSMVSVAAVLEATRRPRRGGVIAALGLLGGVAAGAAVLTKQNVADAAAFAGVLLLAEGWRHRLPRRDLLVVAGAVAAGIGSVMVAALVWSMTAAGVSGLVYAMYGFRVDASEVMASWSHAAPDRRMKELVGLALGSGMVTLAVGLLVGVLAAARRRVARRSPLLLACLAAVAVELVGIVLGGNYWAHYLIGLSPMLALGGGVLATQAGHAGRLVRVLVVLPVVVTIGLSPAAAERVTAPDAVTTTASWLRASSELGDTVVVLYSHANLIGASGLRPSYPFAWSLPIRTLDPDLSTLTALLTSSSRAPTWVVEWDDLHSWGLDRDGRVEAALAAGYRPAATVCGHTIWLREDLVRPLAVPASEASCR